MEAFASDDLMVSVAYYKLEVKPRLVTHAFHRRCLPDQAVSIRAGRRPIPNHLLLGTRKSLRELGNWKGGGTHDESKDLQGLWAGCVHPFTLVVVPPVLHLQTATMRSLN